MPFKSVTSTPYNATVYSVPTQAVKLKLKSPPTGGQGSSAPIKNQQGQLINSKGQLVNKHNQLINEKGQKINDAGQLINKKGQAVNKDGHLINDQNKLINSQGKLVNENGKLVDSQGRLVNPVGRLINEKGHYIDKDSKLVNKEGVLVDKTGRPLDKDGKVARDRQSAAKGNNEPHESLLPPHIKTQISRWQGKEPPASPSKLTVAEVSERLINAEKLVKSGVISSTPGAAQVARDSAIGALVTGVISAPINVAAYSGSAATGEAIKASYLPSPLIPPTPIAKSTVEYPAGSPDAKVGGASAATQSEEDVAAQELYPRINNAQVSALGVANLSIALQFGDTKTGFVPGQNWPADPIERMTQLESLLDFAEEHTSTLAETNEAFFKPYLPEEKAAEGKAGLKARVDTLERRIAAVDKAQKLVLEKLKSQNVE